MGCGATPSKGRTFQPTQNGEEASTIASGRVPQPGIVILGNVTGDVSIFDRPGPITVRAELVNP